MRKDLIIRSVGLTVIFLLFIFFPLINEKLDLVADIESFENRAMHPRPPFNVQKLDPFPAHYDTFYTDHFPLRNRLIREHNLLNIKLFRISPLPDKIVIGSNDWLYNVGEEMDSYLGKNRLTDEELRIFKQELEYRQKYLAERGVKFYFMVVPCKASIHNENIGYEYFRMNEQSWGEQLNEYLTVNSTVKPIDVFDTLRQKRSEGALYYRLDNHWNNAGAFFTANAVFSYMKKDFPRLKNLSRSEYKLTKGEPRGGNLQQMLGNLDVFSEPFIDMTPVKGFRSVPVDKSGYKPVEGFAYPWIYEMNREVKGSDAPRLLVISDSFGESVFPYLSENFSRSVKIFDAWLYRLNEDIVQAERPDAVLLMIDEPILRNLLNNLSDPALKK